MIDQDKKEVRLLQELYFEDGDLGVGQARKRNFRWKNIDELTLNEHVNNKSDGEGDEIITTNVEARMERMEKEKFLQQSQNVTSMFFLRYPINIRIFPASAWVSACACAYVSAIYHRTS